MQMDNSNILREILLYIFVKNENSLTIDIIRNVFAFSGSDGALTGMFMLPSISFLNGRHPAPSEPHV